MFTIDLFDNKSVLFNRKKWT